MLKLQDLFDYPCDSFADEICWRYLFFKHPEAGLAFESKKIESVNYQLGIHPVNLVVMDDLAELRSRLLDKYCPRLRRFIRFEVRLLTHIIVIPLSWTTHA